VPSFTGGHALTSLRRVEFLYRHLHFLGLRSPQPDELTSRPFTGQPTTIKRSQDGTLVAIRVNAGEMTLQVSAECGDFLSRHAVSGEFSKVVDQVFSGFD
jgi:hypothetical protein